MFHRRVTTLLVGYIYISPWHPYYLPYILIISLLYPYYILINILIISLLSLLFIGILYLLYPYYILLFAKSLRCGNFVCGLLCRPPWQSSGEGVASAHRRSEHVEAGATHTQIWYIILSIHINNWHTYTLYIYICAHSDIYIYTIYIHIYNIYNYVYYTCDFIYVCMY